MTGDAKQVINCVYETKGRFGLNIILGTLLGANRARLKELGTTSYKTYGVLKKRSESELRLLISQLIVDGYLCQTADKYSVIRVGNIESLKDSNTHVLIRTYKDREDERQTVKRSRKSTDTLTKVGYELFDVLRKLRFTIAREEGMPPYIIFSDKTLIDMSVKTPRSRSAMLSVSGVGVAKYEKYGERFIEAIALFLDENPDSATSITDNEDVPEEKVRVGKRRKNHKDPFCLNPEDKDRFECGNYYLLSEIKDELNRITTADNVKHIFGTDIFKLLTQMGYVEEKQIDGRMVQIQTELGISKGIITVDKISKIGNRYTVLMYPPGVQREIVEHYIEIGGQVESDDERKRPQYVYQKS